MSNLNTQIKNFTGKSVSSIEGLLRRIEKAKLPKKKKQALRKKVALNVIERFKGKNGKVNVANLRKYIQAFKNSTCGEPCEKASLQKNNREGVIQIANKNTHPRVKYSDMRVTERDTQQRVFRPAVGFHLDYAGLHKYARENHDAAKCESCLGSRNGRTFEALAKIVMTKTKMKSGKRLTAKQIKEMFYRPSADKHGRTRNPMFTSQAIQRAGYKELQGMMRQVKAFAKKHPEQGITVPTQRDMATYQSYLVKFT